MSLHPRDPPSTGTVGRSFDAAEQAKGLVDLQHTQTWGRDPTTDHRSTASLDPTRRPLGTLVDGLAQRPSEGA